MSRSNFSSNEGENGGACAFLSLRHTSLTLDVESCHFVNNGGWGSGGALTVATKYNRQYNATVNIHNSKFSGNTLFGGPHDQDLGGGGALAFHVTNMWNLTLTNSHFTENTAEQKIAGALKANIDTLHQEALFLNCEFVRNSGAKISGTLFLSVTGVSPRVTIQNSTFIQNKAHGFDTYDIRLYQSYLLILFCNIQKNSGGGIFLEDTAVTSDVRVENSVMSDNNNFTFFLNRIGKEANLKFTNVSILRNNCNTKSSIFYVSMYRFRNSLRFQASKFEDNFCKSGVMKISVIRASCPSCPSSDTGVLSSGSEVAINESAFRRNSGVFESALTVLDAESKLKTALLSTISEIRTDHTLESS